MATIKTYNDLSIEGAIQSQTIPAVLGLNSLRQETPGTPSSWVEYPDGEQESIYTEQRIKFHIPAAEMVVDKGFLIFLLSRLHSDGMDLVGEGIVAVGSVDLSGDVQLDIGHATYNFTTQEYNFIGSEDSYLQAFDADTWLEMVAMFDPVGELITYEIQYTEGEYLEGSFPMSQQVYEGQQGRYALIFDGDENAMLFYLDEWYVDKLDDLAP